MDNTNRKEPAYVALASLLAQLIRSGELPPGSQLPSYTTQKHYYAELSKQEKISEIVIRNAMELLISQGLARSVRRRGIFVTDNPNLVRVSPERQMETAEETFQHESDTTVQIERTTRQLSAGDEWADVFGIQKDDQVVHTITRVREAGNPVSISDTYQPSHISGISTAKFLEEKLSDQVPTTDHAEWLGTNANSLVRTVEQKFATEDGQLVMVSTISYPRDRYDAFVFRMSLDTEAAVSRQK